MSAIASLGRDLHIPRIDHLVFWGRCLVTFLAAGPNRPPFLGLAHLEIRALRAFLNSSLCRRTPGLGAAGRSSSGTRACISSLWTLKALVRGPALTCLGVLGQFWARRRPSKGHWCCLVSTVGI